jgi:hypothetical protein
MTRLERVLRVGGAGGLVGFSIRLLWCMATTPYSHDLDFASIFAWTFLGALLGSVAAIALYAFDAAEQRRSAERLPSAAAFRNWERTKSEVAS